LRKFFQDEPDLNEGIVFMKKKIQPDKPVEIPPPYRKEVMVPPIGPEGPLVVPEEIPDLIPDKEAPIETPPNEMPPLGVGL